jgi:serine protease AprX
VKRMTPRLPLSVALALLAGTTTSVLASHELSVTASKSGSALALAGAEGPRTIYTTAAAIRNQRLITFAGSQTMLAVWEEPGNPGARYALLNDAQGIRQIGSAGTSVRLRFASFDPLAGDPAVPELLRAGEANQLFLVQFVATPLEEMRREITGLGGTVHRFLTDNTHLIRMPAASRDAVSQLPYVRWVGAYHPAYRLDETIREQLVGNARMAATRYSIECMQQGQQQMLAGLITKLGGIVDIIIPDQYRLEATLTREQLLAVINGNEVNFVDYSGMPYGTDMDLIRQMGGAVPLLSSNGFLGQGVRGEAFDTQINMTHQQWNGQTPLLHLPANPDGQAHGTSVYGINFATGTGNPQGTGLLPQREQGIFYHYRNATQGFGGAQTRLAANTEATDPAGPYRSSYQTSSIGSPQITTYTTISAEVDDYLFRVDYLSCQSQSNTGNRNSRPQAWAKNIVSVGAMELNETLTRADDVWAAGASIGPAQDLRVKPDLAHSFSNIFSPTDGGAAAYTQFGGTSGATPITAGHFGLLMQMWHLGMFQGFGGGASVFASRPKSTTAKALMINGAFRYTPTGANQMYRGFVGWGMADLTKLYNDRTKFFIINANDALTNGQTRTHTLLVQAGEPEFRVTMVYPDPQGSPAAAQQRINDLTLKVTDPNGIVYWGNNGMVPTAIAAPGQLVGANYSVAGGAANTYDTVENVFIQNPVGGNWTVEIIASQIVQDGYLATTALDAVYSLVASNVTLGPPPPTGACCLPSAPCAVMSAGNCAALNGLYRGDNVTCANANCPPVGACCMGDGTCNVLSQAACTTNGGAYRGDNTACASTNCSGACCLPDGSCSITGGPSCASQNGIYRGDGSTCATANCPLPPGVWVEQGDAGELLASAQITTGANPLNQIRGTVEAANAVDMFKFQICNFANFSATTVNGAAFDTQLFVFKDDGRGAVANDDTGTVAQSLVNNSTSCLTANGTYYIAITGYNRDPNSSTGLIFPTSPFTTIFCPTGPGGANPLLNWNGGTSSVTGAYQIALTGSCFSVQQQSCYANCDGSTVTPILNVGDFTCFLQRFAAGESYANCDNSTVPPVLNVGDFTCFLQRFAAGCP